MLDVGFQHGGNVLGKMLPVPVQGDGIGKSGFHGIGKSGFQRRPLSPIDFQVYDYRLGRQLLYDGDCAIGTPVADHDDIQALL